MLILEYICRPWGSDLAPEATGWSSSGKLKLEASLVPPAVREASLAPQSRHLHGGRHRRQAPSAMPARDLRECGVGSYDWDVK